MDPVDDDYPVSFIEGWLIGWLAEGVDMDALFFGAVAGPKERRIGAPNLNSGWIVSLLYAERFFGGSGFVGFDSAGGLYAKYWVSN